MDEEQAEPGPPSPPLQPAGPVCYSVEAVLGPQLSRLFPGPGHREFSPLQSPDSAPQSQTPQAPYAVHAVLRSGNWTQRFSCDPPQPSPDSGTKTVTELDSKPWMNHPLTSADLWKPGKAEQPPPPPPAPLEGASVGTRSSVNSPTGFSPAESDPGPGLPAQDPNETQQEQGSPDSPAQTDSAAERPKTLTKPFCCLFASPLPESPDRPGSTSQPADRRDHALNKSPSPFSSLFAAPLGAAPFPPHSHRNQRGRTKPTSQNLCPGPRSRPEDTREVTENMLPPQRPGPGQ